VAVSKKGDADLQVPTPRSLAQQFMSHISKQTTGPETVCLFDEVVLMAEGQVVFAGKIEEVVDYFAALGYKQPATMVRTRTCCARLHRCRSYLISRFIYFFLKDVADFIQSIPTPDGALYFDAASSPKSRHYTPFELAEAFLDSMQHQQILDKMDNNSSHEWKPSSKKRIPNLLTASRRGDVEVANATHDKKEVPKQFKVLYQNSFFRSMSLNFYRHLTLWKRDYGYIIGKMFENIGMAVATGGILFGQAQLKDYSAMTQQEQATAAYKLMSGVYGALFMTTFHILLGTGHMHAVIVLRFVAVCPPTLTLLATLLRYNDIGSR
jgi:hypothetical protein